jgi:hypothetical protein
MWPMFTSLWGEVLSLACPFYASNGPTLLFRLCALFLFA